MVRFSFRKGLRFIQQQKFFTLIRRLANGNFQIEDEGGEINSLTETELHSRWSSGKWQIDEESISETSNVFYYTSPADLKTLPEKDQQKILRINKYIQGAKQSFDNVNSKFVSSPEKLAPKIKEIAGEINDKNPPSTTTVWRWWKRYSPTKCVTKLRAGHHRAGRPINLFYREMFEEAIVEVFLTNQKLPHKKVVEQIQRKVIRINKSLSPDAHHKAPSPSSIYRWLDQLYYQIVSKTRKGNLTTEKELRYVMNGLRVSNILERIELDHTPCDAIIICKLTRLILGRPWITLAIDRYSRMIIGFYISFHTPSQTSVLYCMRMMIMPKDNILARFPDIKGPWPARGLPEMMVMDNGMELHGNGVEAVSLEMGIICQYCGVGNPEMKAGIERVIGTANRSLIHILPGTTFSNIKQRGNYDSEGNAAIDIEVLTHLLVKWIVDDYHKTPHRGLNGRTPLEMWQEAEKNTAIELPAFPKQLETIIGIDSTRTLFHYGIEFENLRYHSPILQILREKLGGTPILRLRAFEHDVSYISVFHPDLEEFIDIPAVNQEYTVGLNRHVHSLICAETRSRFNNSWTNEQLLTVKHEIQSIVDEAIKSKKIKTRKKVAALNMSDSEEVIFPRSEDAFAKAREPFNPKPKADPPLISEIDDNLPTFAKSKISS